ncbi:bifunctional 4-hydroxy-2-oxoglutarate aldolase/2-dehydro-3-deoxy-phosphogluconate aldolase [Aeoliella mucimassa]|uniref:2-dehydro-3-deoxy-phosphogluconate aldolase n=1 Tax=Aeoliella mucimassa TaxID=2527972 RepID=A0A518AJC0_9BACT|nr:bifunctional 4-hydroxy-2-oxoglutarate aldolase/2-dehydro-3-deoxy-phosphogluconate aldolase [Aeoliella mucimassa]QDU54796.1 Putative KHG/KDPG aldolase [Aeoliella mucimassa]
MSHDIYKQLGQHRLVPVIALDQASDADPLAAALVAGGLPVAEVTFRTAAAAESIRIMADRGDLLVGAGTVLTTEQVDQAQAAGAQFIVSPGFNPKVVAHAIDQGIPICPGVCTPSDVEAAIEQGLEVVKFFPAEAFGGLATLKAIAAPYKQMRFIPTGGIGPGNVCDYLAFSRVVACGGSWMVKPELYADGSFGQVEQVVAEAVALVQKVS